MRTSLKSRSLFVGSVIVSLLVLVAGWLWARLAISSFQRQEGFQDLWFSPRGADFAWWGMTLPSSTTASVILICGLATAIILFRRRDTFLLVAYLAYGLILAVAGFFLFGYLDFEAFN